MGSVNRVESNDMYSWWWASHISPKNSKWLQENLADMDSKVKQMIRIIEVDEDSFARRAEMYYEKRPELMKLVEEFYRAYRALAERYDHATGLIRHAHKTMPEAFPNQVSSTESDDATCESVASTPSAPFAKLAEGKEELSQCVRLERSENDIRALNDKLAVIEAEKGEGFVHYQESMQRLSSLESEVLRAQQDSRGFHKRANKAETEVHSLKECLAKLEGEKEACLSQYQQYLDRIFRLKSCVSCSQENAVSFEKQPSEAKEAEVLKTEKKASLGKYLEALEKIATLENKLMLAEDEVNLARERADNAEKEAAILKEALDRKTEEKEAASLQYRECLEKIAKLKGAEEQCLLLERSNKSMRSEIETVLFRLGIQNEELSENQKELGRLRKCIQEENVRFVEAETAFRTLQILHSQTEKELRSISAELQKKVQLLKDMEVQNQNLEDEVRKIRGENKSLHEVNTNSAVSLQNMQGEIIKLEGQRNVLQQEIYYLKDIQEENSKLRTSCQSNESEISVLLEKLAVMEKLTEKNASLERSVSLLSTELKDAREKVKVLEDSSRLLMDEKSLVLVEKATVMSQLVLTAENLETLSQRNTFLVNTLFDLTAELEALRAGYRSLEDSCQLLNDERQALELKLEEERIAKLVLVEELHNSLASEKKIHERFIQFSQLEMAALERKICVVEGQLGEELDKSANAQFEMFILKNALLDLRETNCSLLQNCKKFLEKSNLSDKLISKLEGENTRYAQAVATVRDAVASLERRVIFTEVENGKDEDLPCSSESKIYSEMQSIAVRINAVEKNLQETNYVAEERSLTALKSPSISSQPRISKSISQRFSSEAIEKIIKQMNQNPETESTKDIMLDQPSSRTSSRRMTRKVTPYNEPTVDSLERLVSDVQKLTSLQLTVQELKQKVKAEKHTEYIEIKEKLDETERDIWNLLEANNRLARNVQDCSVEQARKWSERIGRLQVETRKVQLLILKLDEVARLSGARFVEEGRKVMLEDYLYGRGAHANRRRSIDRFCGCVRTRTSGD